MVAHPQHTQAFSLIFKILVICPRVVLLSSLYISNRLDIREEVSPQIPEQRDNKDTMYFHNQLQEKITFQVITNGNILILEDTGETAFLKEVTRNKTCVLSPHPNNETALRSTEMVSEVTA